MRWLTFVLLLLLAGCGGATPVDAPPDTRAGTTPQASESRAASQVEVFTAAADLEAARARAREEEGQFLRSYFEDFGEGSLTDFDIPRRFGTRPDVIASRLGAIRDDRTRPPASRTRAAALLCQLGHASCWPGFARLLAGPSDLRARALSQLGSVLTDLRRPPNEILALVRGGLSDDDPEAREAAVGACARIGIPEAAPGLLAVLRAPGPGPKGDAAWALALDAPSVEAVTLAARLLGDPAMQGQPVELALMTFAANADPGISSVAVAALARHAARGNATDDDRSTSIDTMARHASAAHLPALRAAVASTRAPYRRAGAIGGLIRLGEPGALDQAFAMLAVADTRYLGMYALQIGATGSTDRALLPRLLAALPQEGPLSSDVLDVLLAPADPEAIPHALRLAPRLPPDDQLHLVWTTKEMTAGGAAARLRELGVLTRTPEADAEAFSRRERRGQRARESWVLLDMLESSGAVLGFDTETGELPVPHDLLILDLARISGGAFAPEAVTQQWKDRKGDDDFDADYTVQFIGGGRLYRFTAKNLSDWYDVPAVMSAANRALSDSGASGRFVSLFTGDQTARIIYGRPQALQQAAAEFLLVLEDDPDRARRDGRAFEALAIEQLKKGR